MRIVKYLHKTSLWNIVRYIRRRMSIFNDDYVTLQLPHIDEINNKSIDNIYLFYWFSEMINNIKVVSINCLCGMYWHYPTFAVLKLSYSYDEYFSIVIKSKERALIRRAEKNNFYVRLINYDEYLNEIYEINASKEERCGNSMSYDYLHVRPRDSIVKPYNPHIYTFGCFTSDNRLVAYYMFEKITNFFHTIKGIGHADYLNMGIMNFLFAKCVAELTSKRLCEFLIYGSVDPVGGGLSRFKRQVGCQCKHIMIKGSRSDFAILKYFNNTYKLYDDVALNFISDYAKH